MNFYRLPNLSKSTFLMWRQYSKLLWSRYNAKGQILHSWGYPPPAAMSQAESFRAKREALVLRLRDQEEVTFRQISDRFDRSTCRAAQIYQAARHNGDPKFWAQNRAQFLATLRFIGKFADFTFLDTVGVGGSKPPPRTILQTQAFPA